MAPTLPALLCLGEMGGAGGALVWKDPPVSLLRQQAPGAERQCLGLRAELSQVALFQG